MVLLGSRSKNLPVTGPLLKEVALMFAKEVEAHFLSLLLSDFSGICCVGWRVWNRVWQRSLCQWSWYGNSCIVSYILSTNVLNLSYIYLFLWVYYFLWSTLDILIYGKTAHRVNVATKLERPYSQFLLYINLMMISRINNWNYFNIKLPFLLILRSRPSDYWNFW